MTVKEFERYLELNKLQKEHQETRQALGKYEKFISQDELDDLERKLRNFVFQDKDALDNTILKMKLTLNNLGSIYRGYGSYSDPGEALNEIKAVREIINIIDMLERLKH